MRTEVRCCEVWNGDGETHLASDDRLRSSHHVRYSERVKVDQVRLDRLTTSRWYGSLRTARFVWSVTILLWSSVLHAQSEPFAPELGAELIPRASLEAWESYPSELVLSPGETVTTIRPEKTYVVLDTATVPSIVLGDTHYVQVKEQAVSSDGEGPCASSECWVYLGRERSGFAPNLVPASVLEFLDEYSRSQRKFEKGSANLEESLKGIASNDLSDYLKSKKNRGSLRGVERVDVLKFFSKYSKLARHRTLAKGSGR